MNFDESPASLAKAQCFWQTSRAAVSSGPSQRKRISDPSAPAVITEENHEVPQLHPGWFCYVLLIVSRILDLFDRTFYTSPEILLKSILIIIHLIPTLNQHSNDQHIFPVLSMPGTLPPPGFHPSPSSCRPQTSTSSANVKDSETV